jgi:ABC-2 type transport system permease protein
MNKPTPFLEPLEAARPMGGGALSHRAQAPATKTPPNPRPVGLASQWLALCAMIRRDFLFTRRHIVLAIIGPIFSAWLYFLVFALALGQAESLAGHAALQYIAPGLILTIGLIVAGRMSGIALIMAKMEGSIVDSLMAPLSALNFIAGRLFAAVLVGLLAGFGVTIVAFFFVGALPLPWLLVLGMVMASFLLALLGFLTGLWAQRWDQFALIFDIAFPPITVLAGVYAPLNSLPAWLAAIGWANPLTYPVALVRYGYLGEDIVPLWLALLVSCCLLVGLTGVIVVLVTRGWRLRS